MSSKVTAEHADRSNPERRRWKLDPEEIPPELRDNSFLKGCTEITPEEEALLEELAELDRLDP